MNRKDLADALAAVERIARICTCDRPPVYFDTPHGQGVRTPGPHTDGCTLSLAQSALPTLRALADQANLPDADTERLVAHGEHLKDLKENR